MPRTACSEHRGIVGWKTVEPVHFYDLQERLATTPAKLDLSTGSPLLLPEMQQVLRAGIAELASSDELALVLSSYDQMDGLDGLRDQVTGLMTELYRRPVTRAEVLAVPGVQAALRYVHRWLAVRGRRALYPIGLEFPGGVDRTATLAPAVGPYTTVLAADGTSRPVLDVSAIEDWAGVGAVILSRPHSPTGRDWGLAELGALAEAAAAHDALLVLVALTACRMSCAAMSIADASPARIAAVVSTHRSLRRSSTFRSAASSAGHSSGPGR